MTWEPDDDQSDLFVDALRDIGDFLVRLLREGDRSAVIIGSARLDVALERALRTKLCPSPKKKDNLFGPDRPLGTFSAKIALAHRLRIIDDEVERACQAVRKIRNTFAHSIFDETLSLRAHRDKLRSACEPARNTTMWRTLEPVVSEAAPTTPQLEFVLLLALLTAMLDLYSHIEEQMPDLATPWVRFSGS